MLLLVSMNFCKIDDYIIFFLKIWGKKKLSNLIISENNTLKKMKDWPCPIAEYIAPCTCSFDSVLWFYCFDVSLEDVKRVFSVDFPFNNFEAIFWVNENYQYIGELPMNIFQEKSFKEIYLRIDITSIHPKAFESSKDTLIVLWMQGWPDRPIPITKFPIGMLRDFPNFGALELDNTNISDETFMDEDNLFSDVELPNLGKMYSQLFTSIDMITFNYVGHVKN